MNLTDLIGFAAGLLTTLAYLPQILTIVKTRSVKNISLFMYVVMLNGVSLWLVYGFCIHSYPMIISNGAALLLVLTILVLKLKWKSK